MSDNLLNWLSNSIHKAALWLQPPGIKSLTISTYLRDGPVIFLFTPRNPLHQSNYNYNLMKEVALEYYSLEDHWGTKNLAKRLKEHNRNAVSRHREYSKKCYDILNENKIQQSSPSLSVSVQQWINDSCCAKVVMNKCLLCKKTVGQTSTDAEAGICSTSKDNLQEICKGSDIFKKMNGENDYEKQQFCCDEDRQWSDANFQEDSSSSSK